MSAVATKEAVSVDAKDFAQAVAAVAPYAVGRTTISILNTIRLIAKDGAMRLESCNGEGYLSRTIEADGDCDVCLRAATLAAASKALPENGAELIPDDRDNATLTSGRAKFRLPGLDAEDFPAFPKWEGETEPATMSRAHLSDLLRGPLMAVSTDTYKSILTGVSLGRDGDVLVAAAYDGFRLHVARALNPGGELSGVLPSPFLKAIGEMDATEVDIRRLPLEPRQLHNKEAEGRWMARCATGEAVHAPLYGKFVPWERQVPADPTLRAVVSREAFLGGLRRVCGTVHPSANRVRIRLDEDSAHIVATGHEQGDAEDFVSASVMESFEFAANYKFLVDAATFLSGDGLSIHSQGTGLPLILKGDGPNVVVIMPMALA